MGMGKSSLARRLYDVYASEENVSICYIHTAAFKSAMDAARQISETLKVPPQRSFQRQMEGLEQMMADAYTTGRNVVVILDDAQMMNGEALEVIHRLYNFDYDAKVVQILSFGQSEMTGLFETNKAVNARVFVRLALPPLTLGSALQMVVFRLRVAGRNEPLINDEAFELLYEKSRGVPREIIRLCALATDHLLQSDEGLSRSAINHRLSGLKAMRRQGSRPSLPRATSRTAPWASSKTAMSATVFALDSTGPVHGAQPSERYPLAYKGLTGTW